MRRLTSLFLVATLAMPIALSAGCAAIGQPTAAVAADHSAIIAIEGMTCASCSVTVRVAANKLDGIATIDVDVDAGEATVTYDGQKVTAEQIAASISSTGYAATVKSDVGV